MEPIEYTHNCKTSTMINNTDVCLHEIYNEIQNQKQFSVDEERLIIVKNTKLKIRQLNSTYNILDENEERYLCYIHPKKIQFKGNPSKNLILYSLIEFQDELNNGFKDSFYYDEKNKCYYTVCERIGSFLNNNYTMLSNIIMDTTEIQEYYNRYHKSRKSQTISKAEQFNDNISVYSNNIVKPDDSFTFFPSQERNSFIDEIENFMYNPNDLDNFLFITGPSGIGKSITLLSFLNREFFRYSTAYINLGVIRKNSTIPGLMEKYFFRETVTLFKDFNQYLELATEIRKSGATNYWYCLTRIIKYLINTQKSHLLFIDQYKEYGDNNERQLIKLLNLIHGTKVKLLICSSINEDEIRKILINDWMSSSNTTKSIFTYHYYPSLAKVILKENEKGTLLETQLNRLGFLPKYYMILKKLPSNTQMVTFIENEKKRIYKKIIDFFEGKELSLFHLFMYSRAYCDKELSLALFKEIIDFIPLKYYEIYKKDKTFTIIPHFPIIDEIINDYLPSLVIKYHDSNLVNQNLKVNGSYLGIIFEYFIHLTFYQGNPFSKNLPINKVIRVNNLINLKRLPDEIEITENNLYYIQPCQLNAKKYDSALLKINRKGEAKLIYFQITIGKNKNKILSQKDIMDEFEEKIKINFKKKFKIDIQKENFSTYYILLKHNKAEKTAIMLSDEKIPFLYYSMKMNEFYDKNGIKIDHKYDFDPISDIESSEEFDNNLFICPITDKENFSYLQHKTQRKEEKKKLISLIMKDKIKQGILKFLNEEGKNLNFLGMYPPDKCSLILPDNYVIIFEGSSHYYILNQKKKSIFRLTKTNTQITIISGKDGKKYEEFIYNKIIALIWNKDFLYGYYFQIVDKDK